MNARNAALLALPALLTIAACVAAGPVGDPRAWFAADGGRAFAVARVDAGDLSDRGDAAAPTGADGGAAAARARWLVGGGEPAVDGRVALFDANGERIAVRVLGDDVVYAVAVAARGTRAAAGTAEGDVLVLSLPRLEPARAWQHGKPVTAVAFAPDGRWLASGGLDGVVRIGEPAAAAAQGARTAGADAPLVLEHGAPVTCVQWSGDGARVLAGTRDGKVRLHERSGRLVRSWLRLRGEVVEVGFRGERPWCRVRATPVAQVEEQQLAWP